MTTLHPALEVASFAILEAADNAGTWDELPMILVVTDDDDPEIAPVFVPPQMWINYHPAQILDAMTDTINTDGVSIIAAATRAPVDNIGGVLLVVEAHTVDGVANTPESQAELEEFTKTHRLEEHPDAVECRFVTAVDRALTVGLTQHLRGRDIKQDVLYGIEGVVPDALRRFTTALLASRIARHHYTPADTPPG